MAVNVWAADTPVVLVGALREVVIATEGQTVFSIGTFVYTPGNNELGVYINGVRQYLTDSYAETTSSSITFTEGLEVGDKVLFEVNGG
jgi:hypothetical protein